VDSFHEDELPRLSGRQPLRRPNPSRHAGGRPARGTKRGRRASRSKIPGTPEGRHPGSYPAPCVCLALPGGRSPAQDLTPLLKVTTPDRGRAAAKPAPSCRGGTGSGRPSNSKRRHRLAVRTGVGSSGTRLTGRAGTCSSAQSCRGLTWERRRVSQRDKRHFDLPLGGGPARSMGEQIIRSLWRSGLEAVALPRASRRGTPFAYVLRSVP
jgi:hypothetical protein